MAPARAIGDRPPARPVVKLLKAGNLCGRLRNEGRHCSKGGDPAAPSDTATLLRLSPSHRFYLRRLPPLRVGMATSGTPDSHGLTGGVYKARERIHRSNADLRLLATPTSRSRVADCDPN